MSAADTSQTATERQLSAGFARVVPHIGKVAVLQAGETPPNHLWGTASRGGWLLPQILITLHLGQRMGHAPELHLSTDIARLTHFPVCLKVLADLLTDWTITDLVTDAQLQMWAEVSQLSSLTCMTIDDPFGVFDDNVDYDMLELQTLSKMHSMVLIGDCNLATRVPNYSRLQHLELHRGSDNIVDLSCCTSLTALLLTEGQDILRKLILPEGIDVQL